MVGGNVAHSSHKDESEKRQRKHEAKPYVAKSIRSTQYEILGPR
jgi:hypothetical protein